MTSAASNIPVGAPVEGEACAVAWLDLCTLAVTGWIALRLSMLDPADPTRLRLAACGRFWLADLPERASVALAAIRIGAARLREFDALSS